jgi:hypothetical protein
VVVEVSLLLARVRGILMRKRCKDVKSDGSFGYRSEWW